MVSGVGLNNGVSICGPLFTGFDFFLCFYQTRRKRQCFIAVQAENFCGQVIFKPEVCKGFVTLFYCMTTSPLPSSVWYLQWRIKLSPNVFYSVLNATSWPFALILCTALEEGTVYVIFSSQMWPENQVFRELGEVEHQENLLCYIWQRVNFNVLSLIQLRYYSDVTWEEFSGVLGGLCHSLSHIWNYTPVDFKCFSLFTACTSK